MRRRPSSRAPPRPRARATPLAARLRCGYILPGVRPVKPDVYMSMVLFIVRCGSLNVRLQWAPEHVRLARDAACWTISIWMSMSRSETPNQRVCDFHEL